MLSARYRRAVAQALAALQREAEEAAPVIDLCGSQEADAAADIEGADADDEVGEHFSARQVGAWIRTHEKDELADRWDWYERVQRALNGLVRDGRVHMGRLGRFRLADAGRVTARLTLRWDEREEMTLEVSSSCTDARLREIVSKKTGGRLPASKMRLVYPPGFDADDRELGDLPDDTVLDLQIVKSEARDAAALDGPPSGRIVSDPNASPIDEVVEHEAEGTRGWNDGGDGWVNLVAAEEDDATLFDNQTKPKSVRRVSFAEYSEWSVHDIGSVRDLSREKMAPRLGGAGWLANPSALGLGWLKQKLAVLHVCGGGGMGVNKPSSAGKKCVLKRALRESRRNMRENVEYNVAYAEAVDGLSRAAERELKARRQRERRRRQTIRW